MANGEVIPNLGQKRIFAVTEEGIEKKLILQVCDVNQGLFSASKLAASGNRLIIDVDGSFVENKVSGQKTWLEKLDAMYILKLWVYRDQVLF